MNEKKNEVQVCKCCGRELPISEFGSTTLGRLHTCKECVKKKKVQGHLDRKLAKYHVEELEKAKNARLSDFTPRELMLELKRRGYEGKITYVETHEIDLNKL